MRTRILKKESSSKALPLVMMLIGLMSMAQNCGAMEKEKGEGAPLLSNADSSTKEASRDNKERENDTLSALVSDNIHWPEVSPELLQLISLKGPQENWTKVAKLLRLLNDPAYYKNIKEREEKGSRSIEDCQEKYTKEAWEAKEVVKIYLRALYKKTKDLISIVEQYQKLDLYIKGTFGELRSQNQEFLKEKEIFSKEKEELAKERKLFIEEMAQKSELAEKNKQPIPDLLEPNLKEKHATLVCESQEFFGEITPCSEKKEEFIELSKELIKYMKDKEEVIRFIEETKIQIYNLKKTLLGLQVEVEELLSENKQLSQEKEGLKRKNDVLDVNADEELFRNNIDLLVTQSEEIIMKKKRLMLDPQIANKLDDYKQEINQLSKQKAEIDSENTLRKKKISELMGENQRLGKTNEDLSNKVTFLTWGGAACAAIVVFYMILRRGK